MLHLHLTIAITALLETLSIAVERTATFVNFAHILGSIGSRAGSCVHCLSKIDRQLTATILNRNRLPDIRTWHLLQHMPLNIISTHAIVVCSLFPRPSFSYRLPDPAVFGSRSSFFVPIKQTRWSMIAGRDDWEVHSVKPVVGLCYTEV